MGDAQIAGPQKGAVDPSGLLTGCFAALAQGNNGDQGRQEHEAIAEAQPDTEWSESAEGRWWRRCSSA